MENTEITLNGTDWSNLYIIDYSGGSGGEKMCDFLSEKIDGQFTIPKSSDINGCAIDSFDNLYITPLLHLANDDINLYSGYNGKETNGLFHSEDMMKHNLKVNLINRDKDIAWQMGVGTQDEIDTLVMDTHFSKNYILRSHRNISWSSFTNAKVIRIYPWVDSHITYSLMMLKRWVQLDPILVSDLERFMSSDMAKWATDNILSKTPDKLYGWQRELIMTDNIQNFNWGSFVDNSFKMAGTFEKLYRNESILSQSVSPTEWVFGTGDTPRSTVNAITGIDIMSDDITEWQQSNIDLLSEHGISMNSTKEHCIAYFKDYWNLNSIPCVTEA
jgi:hypothetical protein